MGIYVNRVLNMKQIKVISLDMDHTLVRYHTEKFEELTFNIAIDKLINDKEYPKCIKDFKFEFNHTIRGLILDKTNGNLLKVSLYNKIKNTYHGNKALTYKEQLNIYKSSAIDISDPQYMSIDTAFSIAHTIIFSHLVDLKDKRPELDLPEYANMADDVTYAVDLAHRDGSIKDVVVKNLDKYIIKDQLSVEVLERFKTYGKKIWIITNSDYKYTKALLDYCITPYLKQHNTWEDLFEVTITLASKPKFFTDKMPLLKVDPKSGMLENYDTKMVPGIYQGGWALKLQADFNILDREILYLGDHIYGDIVKLKKACGWRTALVIEELDREVNAYKSTKDISIEIDKLMEEKIQIEKTIDELYAKEYEFEEKVEKEIVFKHFDEIEKLDKQLGKLIKSYESNFNQYWGEVMRAGVEPSFYASQIERYACIYMSKISDFNLDSPRKYYRPKKRKIAHEM